jgi:rubrerythrin
MKKTRETNEEEKEQKTEDNQPYRCKICGDRVNYHFIMKFIKDQQLCPQCFNEDLPNE